MDDDEEYLTDYSDPEPVIDKDGNVKWFIDKNRDLLPFCEDFEIRKILWELPKYKDYDNLSMVDVFNEMMELTKKTIYFSESIEYKILNLWIISTWKQECWHTIGFPVFIGPHNSGKTTCLQAIAQMGYRFVKAINPSFASMPRLTHYHRGGLLIDEAHDRLNPRTNSEMLSFIKNSYKKGSLYLTCDNNNQKGIVAIKNFGFKAISGEKTFNPALLSRSIIFNMEEEKDKLPIKYVFKDFEEIRSKLLCYRINFDNPPDLGEEYILKGRTREIFESIISTGLHIGVDVEDVIRYAQEKEKEELDARKDTEEYEILETINEIGLDRTSMPLREIINGLGWDEGSEKETQNNYKHLGRILKKLELKTTKKSKGRHIVLNNKNLKILDRLFKRYDIR